MYINKQRHICSKGLYKQFKPLDLHAVLSTITFPCQTKNLATNNGDIVLFHSFISAFIWHIYSSEESNDEIGFGSAAASEILASDFSFDKVESIVTQMSSTQSTHRSLCSMGMTPYVIM